MILKLGEAIPISASHGVTIRFFIIASAIDLEEVLYWGKLHAP